MRERPILMSAPMVRAILAGTKTQTRRVVKPQPTGGDTIIPAWSVQAERGFLVGQLRDSENAMRPLKCPYGAPGDVLWARETHATLLAPNGKPLRTVYRADGDLDRDTLSGAKWTPGIHMHRRDSRIVLEITDVRVERLQEISDADAIAEGIETTQRPYGIGYRDYRGAHGAWFTEARTSYQSLWESINADRVPWKSNPWVWVLQFRRV